MSCGNELANEWARCSGKNASYITNAVIMVLLCWAHLYSAKDEVLQASQARVVDRHLVHLFTAVLALLFLQEIECLQEKFNNLTTKCTDAIAQFTEEEGEVSLPH